MSAGGYCQSINAYINEVFFLQAFGYITSLPGITKRVNRRVAFADRQTQAVLTHSDATGPM